VPDKTKTTLARKIMAVLETADLCDGRSVPKALAGPAAFKSVSDVLFVVTQLLGPCSVDDFDRFLRLVFMHLHDNDFTSLPSFGRAIAYVADSVVSTILDKFTLVLLCRLRRMFPQVHALRVATIAQLLKHAAETDAAPATFAKFMLMHDSMEWSRISGEVGTRIKSSMTESHKVKVLAIFLQLVLKELCFPFPCELPLNVAVDIFPKVLGAGTVPALVAVCKKVLAANPRTSDVAVLAVVAFLTTLLKAQPESAREIMSTIGAELLGQTSACVNKTLQPVIELLLL
jgi:hypothetical protein